MIAGTLRDLDSPAEKLTNACAADKVCFLASSASSASQPVETTVFSSVTAEASRVVTSIWYVECCGELSTA